MKNLSNVLLTEQISAAQRWNIPSLGTPSAASPGIRGRAGNDPTRPALRTADELDSIANAAREEGFKQGFAEGRTAGLAHADVLLTRMKGVLTNLARPLDHMDAEIQQQLLDIALTLAERILRNALPQQPSAQLTFIREAIELLQSDGRDVVLHLHPDDASALTELLHSTDSSLWRVIPDRNLRPGDVRVQTQSGAIDGRLRQRLEALLADAQVDNA